jgi:protein O-mannosyl-transferase
MRLPPIFDARGARNTLLATIALWMLILLAYSNSFRAGFVFDNNWAILQDSRIRAATRENLNLILTQDYWYRTGDSGLYRPLTTLSYLLNYSILGGGAHAAPYHWVNFALHATNATLLYLLGVLLLESSPLALAMAALWAVHPVLTESVTNIVGRADLLAAFGVLAGLLCHIRSGRNSRWLLGLAAAAAIGVCAKENAIILLAVMAIYDFTFRRPPRWQAYVTAGLPMAIFFYARHRVLSGLPDPTLIFTDNPLLGADFLTARITALQVLGRSIGLLFWPSRLSIDYSYNQILLFAWRLSDWLPMALLAACVAAGIACYRKRKVVFFLVAFCFAAMAPTSNLVFPLGTIMAERFLYLPAIAFAGCLVIAVHHVARRMPHAAWAVLGLVCAALAVRTFVRNFDWADDLHLFASAVASSPDSYKAHLNLAAVSGNSELALREAARALEIVDALPPERSPVVAYAVAGRIYRVKGDDDPAGPEYRKALGVLLRGRVADQAFMEMKRRASLSRGVTFDHCCWAPLYLELGITYLRLAEPRAAIEALEYGRFMQPDVLPFTLELADAWRMAGDRDHAAIALMEGVTLDMNQPAFVQELTSLYREIDPQGCALVSSGGKATINPDCPLVRNHICQASHNVSRLRFAVGDRLQAVAIARGAMHDFGCPVSLFQ